MRAVYALFYAQLRTLARYRSEYVTGALSPLLWAVPSWFLVEYATGSHGSGFTNATGVPNYLAFMYFLIGGIYWNYVEGVWSVAMNARESVRTGTLESIWVTSAPRSAVILGWSLGRLVGITLYSAVVVAVMVAMQPHLSWLRMVEALLVLVTSVLSAYGLGFVLAGLSLWSRDDGSLVSIVGNAAPLFGGVVFPVAMLPLSLRVVSYVFPFTYGADLIRHLVLGSNTLMAPDMETGLLVIMAIVLPVLGLLVFRILERSARVRGLQGY